MSDTRTREIAAEQQVVDLVYERLEGMRAQAKVHAARNVLAALRGDASEFGVHAGAGDHRARLTAGAGGAACWLAEPGRMPANVPCRRLRSTNWYGHDGL